MQAEHQLPVILRQVQMAYIARPARLSKLPDHHPHLLTPGLPFLSSSHRPPCDGPCARQSPPFFYPTRTPAAPRFYSRSSFQYQQLPLGSRTRTKSRSNVVHADHGNPGHRAALAAIRARDLPARAAAYSDAAAGARGPAGAGPAADAGRPAAVPGAAADPSAAAPAPPQPEAVAKPADAGQPGRGPMEPNVAERHQQQQGEQQQQQQQQGRQQQATDDQHPPRPSYALTFTCKPCGHRSSHTISKQGYHHGTVLITCPECKNRHVISDHLRIFVDESVTVESLLQKKGEIVKKGRLRVVSDGHLDGDNEASAQDLEFWNEQAAETK